MGRLEDIIARNRHPRRYRKQKFPLGTMVAGFVLLVLILMIFTDLGLPSYEKPAAPPPDPTVKRRVDGVLLYRERPRVTPDAGGDDAKPSGR